MATGYTGGDPSKLARAGGTMTGPLVLSGPPTAPLHPATKAYVDALPAGGGGGVAPVIRHAYITTGDVTLADNPQWVPLPDFELPIPAVIGDWVELSIAALLQSAGSHFFDLVVLVGGSIVRRSSTGTASGTGADEGDPAIYPNASGSTFRTSAGPFGFAAQAGDLDSGAVRFAIATKGAGGGGKVFASTNYPFRWRAINYGAVILS